MVKAYSILIWISFLFSLALTVFTSYLVFSKSNLIQCYDKDLQEVSCSSVFSTGKKIGFLVGNIISLFIYLCKRISTSPLVRSPSNLSFPPPDICIVIRRYVDQLEDEQVYKNDFGMNKKQKSFYPFQSIESDRGLLDSKR